MAHSTGDRAPSAALTLGALLEALRRDGLRITANRRNILRALLAARGPLSLEEIQTQAAAAPNEGDPSRGARPDFATVFRMMATLERLGLVQRVHLGRASSHFELLDPRRHHDHLVCVDCGQVTLLEDVCPVEKLERRIAQQYGYRGVTHSLEFFGHCQECTRKSEA
jgi:Fur family ferric uptake transcriptional regulator